MLKKILLALVATSLFLGFTSASETGIKFAVNTQVFNLIKKIDFSQKLSNTSLIGAEGINYTKNSFPSVNLKVANLTIVKFENPENVEVGTEIADKSMLIHLKGIKVNLQVGYELRVMSILKDAGRNSNIEVAMDEFVLALQFTGNKIVVKSLNFKLSKVDFSLNQFILNLILKMFKSTIISKINQSVELMRVSMEQKMNVMINTEKVIDLAGMGIGVNATVTDKPDMQMFDQNRLEKAGSFAQIFVDLVQEILESEEGKAAKSKFLNLESTAEDSNNKLISSGSSLTNKTSNDNLNSFLTGGIRGAIFATIAKELKPKIPEPLEMQFTERYLKNKINLLISDYTINTLLFFVQQSGYINIRVQNDTNGYFPFNVDIEGFKGLFPNLTRNYAENFPVEIKMNIASSGDQPQIVTDSDGSRISLEYGFELKVYNSTDIFDDPITELKMNVKSHLQVQYMIDDTFLHVIVFRNVVDELDVKTNLLDMETEGIKKSINDIQEKLLEKFRPSFANVNVESLLQNTFGYKFDSFEFDARKGYLEISVDIPEI